LLARYGGSLQALLADTFPEMFPKTRRASNLPAYLTACNTRFSIGSEGYWDNIENRRQFLRSFAAKMEFDPWIAENWRDKKPQLRAAGVPNFIIITLSLSLSLSLSLFLTLNITGSAFIGFVWGYVAYAY